MKQDFVQLSVHNSMNYEQARINMLTQQIRTWHVFDDDVLSLFYTVRREEFVPEQYQHFALADLAIPLANGQSMMTPKEEARVLQNLYIQPTDRALILGVDSGFLVTLIAKLAAQVYYVNNDLDSFEKVKNKIIDYQLTDVISIIGNIDQGWAEAGPFDIILLTGSLPTVPDFLREALTIGGRLFVVLGQSPVMQATIISRTTKDAWNEIKIFETNRPRMLDVKESNLFTF